MEEAVDEDGIDEFHRFASVWVDGAKVADPVCNWKASKLTEAGLNLYERRKGSTVDGSSDRDNLMVDLRLFGES